MKKISHIFILSLFIFLLWSSCSEKDDPSNSVNLTPTLTGFSPTSGTAGTTVTLTGTNFSTTAASNVVKFNGTTATITAATATSLTVSVPAGSTTGKVTVEVDNQVATSTTDFTINPPLALTLSSFSPATGPSGTNVNLVGTNFSTTAANNVVKFNGALAIVTAAGPTSLAVTVPAGASTGKITVQVGSEVATSNTDFVYIQTAMITVSTFAGNGTLGFTDDMGTAARFYQPTGVALDAAGNVYVADAENNRIRKITPAGAVSTLAGSGTSGSVDGTGTAAQFFSPRSVAVDASGNVYVADGANHLIRKITPAGEVSTLAGSGEDGFADGEGTAAQFYFPKGIAVDASGNVYVADDINHRVRKITPTGTVSTLAGSTSGSTDGDGTAAKFNRPTGIAVDALGNLYVADAANHRIRKISSTGIVSTLAGSTVGHEDGTGSDAEFNNPTGVAVDASGNVYVAEEENGTIRKITSSGTVSTVAGMYSQGLVNGDAADAKFRWPAAVALDASGTVYVADRGNHCIRKIQ